MNKISPFLWFDTEAEEAAYFYTSIFKNSRIGQISRFPEGSVRPAGMIMTVTFFLDGMEFTALNGGPEFKFTEALSLHVTCESQEEVDYYWEKLTEGGEEVQCGWLKDKYGLSWQIDPKILGELMSDPDPLKAKRVNEAMLKMKKIKISELMDAYNGV